MKGSQIKYATYWENLLLEEYKDTVEELRERRKKLPRRRLEQLGISIFEASAEPDSDLYGEKIVRIYKNGETLFRDKFSRGDVLVMTPVAKSVDPKPRECLITDVGKDWMTLGVGPTWPSGLWEARKLPGFFEVRLDRTAPQAPLRAQREALDILRNGYGGSVARLLANSFYDFSVFKNQTSLHPLRYGDSISRKEIKMALNEAKNATAFCPNWSQEASIVSALKKRVSLIRGPPGTGKTRVAALLISTALRLRSLRDETTNLISSKRMPRVLAVAHSNGAADVLLSALIQMGVPAVRLGRPASVGPKIQHRTVIAMSDKMPEVVRLRRMVADMTLDSHARSGASFELRQAVMDAQKMITQNAPVVVTTCIGAYQLLEDNYRGADDATEGGFPLVVLDEAAQTTEPALICALVAARAEQVCLVGDTKQLPPTITSMRLRDTLGVSPMSRLEQHIGETTLRLQYRMTQALLEHPSAYFYNGLVKSAEQTAYRKIPRGFPWPSSEPLAFVQVGNGDSEIMHNLGGRSNACEAESVVSIVLKLIKANRSKKFGVAVISPYSKQVQLIRTKLADAALMDGHSSKRIEEAVRVGTVDSFQGQETDVVVMSAVRSNPMRELGFLRDNRRLCVAITRARSGLVVVGDKATLKSDRHWCALIESMEERNCTMDSKKYWQAANGGGETSQDLSADSKTGGNQEDEGGNAELYGLFSSSGEETYGLCLPWSNMK